MSPHGARPARATTGRREPRSPRSDSYPGGRRRCASQFGYRASISDRSSPSHWPADRSIRSSSASPSWIPAPCASNSPVRRARARVEVTTTPNGPHAASSTAASRACSSPSGESGASARPCQRPIAFHVDWPWRTSRNRVGSTSGRTMRTADRSPTVQPEIAQRPTRPQVQGHLRPVGAPQRHLVLAHRRFDAGS